MLHVILLFHCLFELCITRLLFFSFSTIFMILEVSIRSFVWLPLNCHFAVPWIALTFVQFSSLNFMPRFLLRPSQSHSFSSARNVCSGRPILYHLIFETISDRQWFFENLPCIQLFSISIRIAPGIIVMIIMIVLMSTCKPIWCSNNLYSDTKF